MLSYHLPMQLPTAPAAKAVKLRGDYSAAAADYSVEQAWSRYTSAEHALWGRLVQRQMALVKRYGAAQVAAGLKALDLDERIPRFDEASRVLRRGAVGKSWRFQA
jgi:phenylalanine-4-hydroxylase